MPSHTQVLVVEDNDLVRFALLKQLEKLGINAHSAQNGLDAMTFVHSHQYSLVLMDLQMPEMDGYEAAAAIRQYEKQQCREFNPVLIIAVTAGGDKRRALAAGMNDFVQKPLFLDQLRAVIRKWRPGLLDK